VNVFRPATYGTGVAVFAAIGLLLGLAYFVVAVTIGVVNPQSLQGLGNGWVEILPRFVLLYFGGGFLGGTAVGLLLPITRWATGAMSVGGLVVAIVYGLASYVVEGEVDYVFAAVCAVAGGIPGGLYVWTNHIRSTRVSPPHSG
jgi:hypothetical protein